MSSSDWKVDIGLETHVQLGTQTKIFCSCPVRFGQAPNTQVCPVCLGLPGALPVFNKKVFELGLRAALGLHGTISKVIQFDRKNYFYPDLPKNYQISQYAQPLASGGFVEIVKDATTKQVRLRRVHLEEDAGKLMHDLKQNTSFVDFNRGGVPLIEIVSEPDLESPEEAYLYLTSLKRTLEYLKVSDCDMEKGHLRCDANISVRKVGETTLGVKVEIKNLNSFRGIRSALEYERERQIQALTDGEGIHQETRLWNDPLKKTILMRSKEEAHDYRYFPDPDLVPFTVSDEEIEKVRQSQPELPWAKKKRFIEEYQLTDYDAEVLTQDRGVAEFFEAVTNLYNQPKKVANWVTGSLLQTLNEDQKRLQSYPVTPHHLANMLALIDKGTVSITACKEKVFAEMMKSGRMPDQIVRELSLSQVSDSHELEEIVDRVLKDNQKSVNDYQGGKPSAMQFLIGQTMRAAEGKANPAVVRQILESKLNNARKS